MFIYLYVSRRTVVVLSLLVTFCVYDVKCKRTQKKPETGEKTVVELEKENQELQAQLEELSTCTARLSELEYHNHALRMIADQQMPQLEEDKKKAVESMKDAQLGRAY